MTERTDYAVVGAGVLGCLIAREIVRRDAYATVTVLEREAVAGGASRRSAGLHFPRGGTSRVRAMADDSQRRYARLRAEQPGLPIHSLPMTVIAPSGREAELREVYVPDAGLRPATAAPAILGGVPEGMDVWEADGCQYADVHSLTQVLAAGLRPAVRFREGVRVDALEPAAGEVRLRLSTGDVIEAGHVVLAPGPWVAAPAWRELTGPLGVRVKKIVALHIERPPAPGDGAVVLHEEDAFLLPYHDRGHWLFSYTCQEWDVDPDTVPSTLSPQNRREALEILGRYAPGLVDECRSGRVFCDAYSPGREPVVRPLTEDGRVVFAGAANGSGYRLAPALAALTADLLPLPSSRKVMS
ncbi:NAD(P)/FAD-dependent oxidoreductase [Streptomyces sp. CO7]